MWSRRRRGLEFGVWGRGDDFLVRWEFVGVVGEGAEG